MVFGFDTFFLSPSRLLRDVFQRVTVFLILFSSSMSMCGCLAALIEMGDLRFLDTFFAVLPGTLQEKRRVGRPGTSLLENWV